MTTGRIPLPPERVQVSDAGQVTAARVTASHVAHRVGLSEQAVHTVELVAAELAENLHRHATGGELLVLPPDVHGATDQLRIVAVDRGPGVEDFERCLADGFSTIGTLGAGLGTVRRMSDDFAAVSEPGVGTVVRAGFRIPGVDAAAGHHHPFAVGVVAFPLEPGTVNGDDFAVVRFGSRIVVLVADGLGHGPGAAEASGAAVREFLAVGQASPAQLVTEINHRMATSRGAAITVASLDLDAARDGGPMHSSGLGNVSLLVAAPDGHTKRLMTSMGTAGVRSRRTTTEQRADFPARGVLVLHTDGLGTRWTLDGRSDLLRQPPDLIATALWRDHCRSSDDSLVLVVRAGRREVTA